MQNDTFTDYAGMGVLFNTVIVLEAASEKWHEELSSEAASATPTAKSSAEATPDSKIAGDVELKSVKCPKIITIDPIVERKSTVCVRPQSTPPHIAALHPQLQFLGHAAEVHSVAEVNAVMSQLLEDNHIARATHNMMAYRFFDDAAGVWRSDNDEDGEDAAGGRMSMLLEMMQVRSAVVVVTRWYGGVLLGPSRFKLINNAARQALLAAGLSGREE